jgi:MYXO-CTERM domain-containing protein
MITTPISARRRFLIAAPILCTVIVLPSASLADNPIVQTNFTSDPAPMVYDGTMYLITTHDENVAGQPCTAVAGYTLCKWFGFSSKDMVNWTDHGTVASWSTFSWAADAAWAPQAIPRNGKFYLYAPLNNKSGATQIGVGVSTSPIGPYQDALGQPLVTAGCNGGTGDIDPTVFIDDDGQAYLYFGRSVPGYVKLNTDMISYTGGVQCPTDSSQTFGPAPSAGGFPTQYEEGPWIMKHSGTYILAYAANNIPEDISYSTATAPGGPFTYGGTIMKASGASFTNHTGIIDFNGHSYFFYHNGALQKGGSVPSNGDGYHRSVCLEEFTYTAAGAFPTITQTTTGPNAIANLNPYVQTEAETIAWESGVQTEVCSDTGGGMDVTAIQNGSYIKVKSVDFGSGATSFAARVASATSGGKIEIHLDTVGGTILGTCTVQGTGGAQTWATVTCPVSGATSVHDLFFKFTGGTGNLFSFNWWQFTALNPSDAGLATDSGASSGGSSDSGASSGGSSDSGSSSGGARDSGSSGGSASSSGATSGSSSGSASGSSSGTSTGSSSAAAGSSASSGGSGSGSSSGGSSAGSSSGGSGSGSGSGSVSNSSGGSSSGIAIPGSSSSSGATTQEDSGAAASGGGSADQGCGCRVGATNERGALFTPIAAAVGILVRRRRRQSGARARRSNS